MQGMEESSSERLQAKGELYRWRRDEAKYALREERISGNVQE